MSIASKKGLGKLSTPGLFYFMEHFYPMCNRVMRSSIGVQIVLKNPDDRSKMCVYFIWFGNKYYVGATKNLFKRSVSHQLTLNRTIDKLEVGSASVYNILKHLYTDLTVDTGIMEMVYEAESVEDLSSAEGMYLRDSASDENCLNHSQFPYNTVEKRSYPMVDSVKGSTLESINECVFKLYYKDKFVIAKGKSFIGTLKNISRAIEDFAKKDEDVWPADHLYYHLIALMLKEGNPSPEYRCEIVLVVPNAVELLKKEQELLWENSQNPLCLNNTFDAYIPIYKEETGMYGWINKGSFMAFSKWKSKNMPQ